MLKGLISPPLATGVKSIKKSRNSPVKVVEEGEEIEGQLTPCLLLTVTQGICVHEGRNKYKRAPDLSILITVYSGFQLCQALLEFCHLGEERGEICHPPTSLLLQWEVNPALCWSACPPLLSPHHSAKGFLSLEHSTRETTCFTRHPKMRPWPATASQVKSHVPS